MHPDLRRLVGLDLLLRQTNFLQIFNLSNATGEPLIDFSRSAPDQTLQKVPFIQGLQSD